MHIATLAKFAVVSAAAGLAIGGGSLVFAHEDGTEHDHPVVTTTTATQPTVSGQNRGGRLEELLKKHRAKMGNTGSSTRPVRDGKKGLQNLDGDCIQDLVAERDGVLYTSFSTFSTSILAAMDERRTAVFDAWGMSDTAARAKAIAAAWQEWKKDSKAAHSKLRSDRKSAWDTFRTDAKAECKVTVPKEETQPAATSDSIAL
jgi:hypothetical protein